MSSAVQLEKVQEDPFSHRWSYCHLRKSCMHGEKGWNVIQYISGWISLHAQIIWVMNPLKSLVVGVWLADYRLAVQ